MSEASTSTVTTCGVGQSQSAAAAQSGPFTGNSSITDVAAELAACPGYRVDQPVRFGLSGFDARSQSHRAKDASPVGQHPPRVFASTRVEHLAGKGGSAIEPLDDIAFADLIGISRSGHHNTQGR